MNKELEPGSEYEKYDADGDGVVTDAELATTERLQALEIANEKAEAQKTCAGLPYSVCSSTQVVLSSHLF